MAVDKSYGSGKSRSAANSRARQRVAAGQMTKGKKNVAARLKDRGGVEATIRAGNARAAASPLGQLADTVFGFALPVGKVKAAAAGLRATGQTGKAAALESRVLAKQAGRELGPDAARDLGPSFLSPVGTSFRKTSESLYPKLPIRGGDAPSLLRGQRDLRTFDEYADLTNAGAGRFARGTKRGDKLVKAIEKNEVQSGMYIGSKAAIKRAAFNSTRPVSKLPKRGR